MIMEDPHGQSSISSLSISATITEELRSAVSLADYTTK
jgi:hypothetical protein